MLQEKMLKPLEFEFHGKAGEYFRIWIVNVLLTILTLGIYSAWAKVRNKQYFYGNTILDDSPFEYTASPIAILKGRAIVAAVLGANALIINFFPIVNLFSFLLLGIFIPWLIMRGLMFNARYSSYRNLNFYFEKNVVKAYKTFFGVGILVLISIGLLFPYFMYRIQSYRVNNHSFGQLTFRLKNSIKSFYKYYFIGGAGLILTSLLSDKIVDSFLQHYGAARTSGSEAGLSVTLEILFIVFVFATIFSMLAFFFYTYIKAKIFNVVWSNTSLNKASAYTMSSPTVPLVAFKGNISVMKLFKLMLTNTLAIIISFGLLIPWAKIRLAKYRISCLSVASIADLKAITSVEREKVGATGSEMGEVFDIDIGI